MVIDIHTHVFPRQKGPAILSELSGRAEIDYFSDGSVESLVQSMKQAGISLSLVSRITTQAEGVSSINSWLIESLREGIQPLAAFHPDVPDLEHYMKTLKSQGFKGIKLHLDYQGIYADERKMYPVYETAQSLEFPILFHAGLDRGLPPPVRATPKRLLNIHRQFTDLKMIAAHMGGEDNYEETEACLFGTGVYLDTSYVLRIMELDTLKRFFAGHPVERFLFGTDSPFTDQATELAYFQDLPFLTQKEKDKILGENATRLFNL
jgi:predicted TIM-barrel fold metal-dependent hydrolase